MIGVVLFGGAMALLLATTLSFLWLTRTINPVERPYVAVTSLVLVVSAFAGLWLLFLSRFYAL